MQSEISSADSFRGNSFTDALHNMRDEVRLAPSSATSLLNAASNPGPGSLVAQEAHMFSNSFLSSLSLYSMSCRRSLIFSNFLFCLMPVVVDEMCQDFFGWLVQVLVCYVSLASKDVVFLSSSLHLQNYLFGCVFLYSSRRPLERRVCFFVSLIPRCECRPY